MANFATILKCPDMLKTATSVIFYAGLDDRKTKTFPMNIGQTEAIDLIGLSWNISGLTTETIVGVHGFDLGLSVLDSDGENTFATPQTPQFFHARPDLLWSRNVLWSSDQATGFMKFSDGGDVFFPIPPCLVYVPTFEVNQEVANDGGNVMATMRLYYIKRGAVKTALAQLMKYWQDAKL
jgi:hypothetical protein